MCLTLREWLEDSPHFTSVPSKKDEKWKFSNLDAYLERKYTRALLPEKENIHLPEEKYWLLLKDGQLMDYRLPSGVHIKTHAPAYEVSNNPFACLATQSAFSPLELTLHESTDFSVYFDFSKQSFINSSLNIVLKEKVRSNIFFSYTGAQESFVSHSSHIMLHPSSSLALNQIQDLEEKSLFISQNSLHLKEKSSFQGFSLLHQGEYLHNFTHAQLAYKSRADINSLLLNREDKKEIFSCDIEHLADHSSSHVHSRQVLRDKSTCAFDANTKIHKGTRENEVKQASHALILDEGAQVYSKPHLEIYSDDLSASHGSTVGELDVQALDYLVSRGIPKEKARSILISAFISEIIETVEDDQAREHVQRLMGEEYAL